MHPGFMVEPTSQSAVKRSCTAKAAKSNLVHFFPHALVLIQQCQHGIASPRIILGARDRVLIGDPAAD